MRQGQFRIDGRDVEQCAFELLLSHFDVQAVGRVAVETFWRVLLWAAARLSSIHAACEQMRGAPSDDTIRNMLARCLPPTARLQRQINAALLDAVPTKMRRGKHRYVVAMDVTLIPYHGQPFADEREIYRGQAKSGTTHFHAYATVYVVHHGRRFTLGLVWLEKRTSMETVVRQLVARLREIEVIPKRILLDRGFFSGGVVRYLKAARLPFLMPVPMRGKKPGTPGGPTGTQIFNAWRKSGLSTYRWIDATGKSAAVKICVHCRSKRGRWTCRPFVYAYWGFQPSSPRYVRQQYRRRFGIETSYRQMHQARIRTCSRRPDVRLLFVGLALILRNLWVWLHLIFLSEPRRGGQIIELSKLRFRTMLHWLLRCAEKHLGTIEATESLTT